MGLYRLFVLLCGIDPMSRKERLLEALERLREVDGSPDLIDSVLKALEDLESKDPGVK